MSYWIYILTNRRNITFYIGMTKYPEQIIVDHQRGEGSGFTRKYKLQKLVYLEEARNPYEAIDRENELKGWARSRCELLIAAVNPKWEEIHSLCNTRQLTSELKSSYDYSLTTRPPPYHPPTPTAIKYHEHLIS